ncbi:MAG: family 1 glycosylhydrolase [Acidimicrobiia bacterium]|nr:family 1 glycosylhydrolase [Acidimicrobiia bacterium]
MDHDFWWGVTSSSVQAEGVAAAADWSRWERDERVPRSGDGAGFGIDFRDDLALLAGLGLSHVRLTVEWARLEPTKGKLDTDELDRYVDVLRAARSAGITPIVTLHSTTLPGWFHDDEGGFRDERGRGYLWARHVDRCAETFDGLAGGWVGVDDPIGWAVRAHLLGSRPPGNTDPARAMEFVEGALEADRIAADILRGGDAPVISAFAVPTIFPVGPDAGPKAQWWDDLFWSSWIGAIRDGELCLPGIAPRPAPELVACHDIVGFSTSHPLGVDPEGRLVPYPTGARRDDTGFAPTPEETGVALRRLADALPRRPLAIVGNGVSTTDDDWRDELLRETLGEIDRALDDGVPLVGYLYDTGIDGYEWHRGFTSQRGLVGRDREPKPSADRLSTAARRQRG